MDRDAIKDRIRKLLNLAENDAATEGEIENAMRFAQRLMAEHCLTEADVQKVGEQSAEQVAQARTYGKHAVPMGSSRTSQWEWDAACAVCGVFQGQVQVYRTHTQPVVTPAGLPKFDDDGNPIERRHWVFYGPDAESVLAGELFLSVALAIQTMARLRYGSVWKGAGRSYAEGFAEALMLKVASENRDASARASLPSATGPGTGSALVLRSKEITKAIRHEAKNYLQREHGVKLSNRGGGSLGTGKHYAGANDAGRRDGSKFDLRRPTATRKLPGR